MFEFRPFSEEPPEEGYLVELRVPNPDYEEELASYRASLELNPFANSDVSETFPATLTQSPDELVDAHDLCLRLTELTLVVGYPFASQYAVSIKARTPEGFTHADLFEQIVRVYAAMYAGSTSAPVEHLYNKRVESPRFGEAWHEMKDLVIERVLLDDRGGGRILAWISIGS